MRRLGSLNDGWEYAPGSGRGGLYEGSLETEPESVTVPHSWNTHDAVDPAPGYGRSVGFSRRELDLRGYQAGARFILYFEGANTAAEVRVNGRRAGGHVGGYVGFEVDITSYVARGAPNVLLVRVSNADDPALIPSSRSDFVIYGGLTRNVWLRVVPPTRISHVSVRTPTVTRDRANAVATVTLASPALRDTVSITARLVDRAGKTVATTAQRRAVGRDSLDVELALPVVRTLDRRTRCG